jgi:23S rRNA (adenine2503-C2)-methyltransferase
MKRILQDLTLEELKELMSLYGEKPYRAMQIKRSLHSGKNISEMTDLSKNLRSRLVEDFEDCAVKIIEKLVSKDGTEKYLFSLADGHCVESVVMRYKHGNTICISSQVGCLMGCVFCASTIGGKVRDLEPAELLGQVIAAQRDMGERISNIVMMGIGEPLDNYDNVIKFLRLVGHEKGINIGYRHISLSTCGLVDKIDRLAAEEFPITLSISLHASDDKTRCEIMPINKKWKIDELLGACKRYFATTGRRISFEYALIRGKNDSPEAAASLAGLLNSRLRSRTEGMPIHVNLIPLNPVSERAFSKSSSDAVNKFKNTLISLGINATVRRKLGPDINASCGQLRLNNTEK